MGLPPIRVKFRSVPFFIRHLMGITLPSHALSVKARFGYCRNNSWIIQNGRGPQPLEIQFEVLSE
jgi:hypothetical protein